MWDPSRTSSGIKLSQECTIATQSKAKVDTSIGIPSSRGTKRYFEVGVAKNRGAIFVGWVSEKIANSSLIPRSRLDKAIGYFPETWAIDSYSGSIGSANKWVSKLKSKIRAGDFIGSCIDPQKGTLEFFINGESMGIAFSNIPKGNYYPACSLKFRNTEVFANFRSSKFPGPSDSLMLAWFTNAEQQEFTKVATNNELYNLQNVQLLKIPPETLIAILSFLSAGQLGKMFRVCRTLLVAASEPHLWIPLLHREYNITIPKEEFFRLSSSINSDISTNDISHNPNSSTTTVPSLTEYPQKNHGAAPGKKIRYSVQQLPVQYYISNPLVKRYRIKASWNRGIFSKSKVSCRHSPPHCLQYDSDILIAGIGSSLELFHPSTLEPKIVQPHQGTHNVIYTPNQVLCLQFTENKEILAIGCTSGNLALYNLDTWECKWHLPQAHTTDIESVHFNPNKTQFLATGGWDKSIKVWDINKAQPEKVIQNAHGKAITFIRFVSDKLIMSGSYDHKINFFDSLSNMQTPSFNIDFKEIVNCWSFDPAGRIFAVGGETGAVRLYDMRYLADTSSGFVKEFHDHTNVVKAIQYDGSFLVSGSYDQQICGRNIRNNSLMFSHIASRVLCLQFDETKIVFGDESKRLRALDFTTSPPYPQQKLREIFVSRMNQ